MSTPENQTNLINESDRGAVIVAAALLEDDLSEKLKGVIKNNGLSSRQLKEFFDLSGPLSSFSSKALICYAFGLITKDDFDDLVNLRKLRNKFAHTANHVSFLSLDVKKLVEELNCCIEASKYYKGEVFHSHYATSVNPDSSAGIYEWDLRAQGLITVTKSLFCVGVIILRENIKTRCNITT